jgi:hypothetical protein
MAMALPITISAGASVRMVVPEAGGAVVSGAGAAVVGAAVVGVFSLSTHAANSKRAMTTPSRVKRFIFVLLYGAIFVRIANVRVHCVQYIEAVRRDGPMAGPEERNRRWW